jgi:uncharacterized lipoprotein YajG
MYTYPTQGTFFIFLRLKNKGLQPKGGKFMTNNKRLLWISLLLLTGTLLLFGCSKKENPLSPQPIEPVTEDSSSQEETTTKDEKLTQDDSINIDDATTNEDVTTVNYEIIPFDTLSAEIQNEVDFLKQSEGYFMWNDPQKGNIVFIGMGLKPSGGFSIDLEKVELIEGVLHVFVNTSDPGPDDMVTQALMYPFALIQLDSAVSYDSIRVNNQEDKDFLELTVNNENQLIVEGMYVGQIDKNSIEVTVGDSFQVFRNFLMSEIVENFESGDLVTVTYTETEEGQYQLIRMEPIK